MILRCERRHKIHNVSGLKFHRYQKQQGDKIVGKINKNDDVHFIPIIWIF